MKTFEHFFASKCATHLIFNAKLTRFLLLAALFGLVLSLHSCKKNTVVATFDTIVVNGVTYIGIWTACDTLYPPNTVKETDFFSQENEQDTIILHIYNPITSGTMTLVNDSFFCNTCSAALIELYSKGNYYEYFSRSGSMTVNGSTTTISGVFYSANNTQPPFQQAQLTGIIPCP